MNQGINEDLVKLSSAVVDTGRDIVKANDLKALVIIQKRLLLQAETLRRLIEIEELRNDM